MTIITKEIHEEATSLHYEDCDLELQYYEYLAAYDKENEEQLHRAIKETCEAYDIPEQEYLNGTYEFEYDEYSEFLLNLVNTIAEYYGIDNHYYY